VIEERAMAKKDDVKTPAAKSADVDASDETERDEDEGEEEADDEGDEENEDDADDEDDDADDEDDDADDEDDDADDEDEDEDEDDDEHEAQATSLRVVAPTQFQTPHPTLEPQDPTWWLPHVVLGALILIGVLGFFGVFTSILGPPLQRLGLLNTAAPEAPKSAAATSKPAAPPPVRPAPPTPQKPPANPNRPDAGETYGAKHILVMYKGSRMAPPNITRTKDEAKKRAEEVEKKLKSGTKFEDLVGDYSDEPAAKQSKGDLGKFKANAMVPAFSEAVKKLKVNEISDPVETEFGFHIIVRTL